jgi:hypothetical protein
MSLKPLFSTYRQGENRVTASLLAVLSRLGTDLTERVLGALLDEPELSLVSFTPLPATKGAGNPDGEIRAQFRCLLEVKTVRGALASESAATLKAAYVTKLGDDPSARLIILTPDGRVPKPLEAVSDARVVWVSFVKLATALREILDDQDEPAGERERYLIRELMALFRVEGLIDALDTVVVAARRAYQLYLTYDAYACQPNRAVRPVQRMAFYTAKEIKPEIPEILGFRRDISISAEQARSWSQSKDPVDRAVAEIIRRQLEDGVWHSAGRHDVYWLSPADDPRTAHLARPLPYLGAGAFTQGQRYVDLARLKSAKSCDEAVARP